jgi:amino acid adenylation domain-containing protein
MDLGERIAKLSPEQRKLLGKKLEQQQVDILKLPIPKQKRTPSRNRQQFPLSFAQKRMWFIQQLEPDSSAYNITKAVRLTGALNPPALSQSINEIVRHHEILRTIFITGPTGPVQVVRDELTLPLERIDLRDLPGDESDREIRVVILEESRHVFDLTRGPLLRTRLIAAGEDEHIFILTFHHIISDAVSAQVFIRELVRLYGGFLQGKASRLPALPIQYADYACWQHLWFGGGAENTVKTEFNKKQQAYWLEQFSGEIPLLDLPADYPRAALQSFEGGTKVFCIPPEETGVLKTLISKENLTLFMALLALYNIFLAKLSGMEDIVVGTPAAGRRHPDVRELIGMFVNTLALRNFPRRYKNLKDFLREVKTQTLKAFENQEYRYEDLLGTLEVPRDTGRNPLFDAMFLVKNIWVDLEKINIRGLTLKTYEYENRTSKFDLTLSAWDEETLYFSFEYCTRLFTDKTIERFILYFKQVIHAVAAAEVDNFEIKIADIDILPENERRLILFDFNDTRSEYPREKTIHGLFAEQAKQTPDHIAMVGVRETHQTHQKNHNKSHMSCMSYNQLNEKSNQLAYFLKEKGVKPDTIVAIMVERSLEMIIGILGILKAGGAYLPMDPDYPPDRIDYMLAESGTTILLKKSEIRNTKYETNPNDPNSNDQNKRAELKVLDFEHLNFEFVSNFEFRASDLNPSNLAYVIYTSGSTGRPKGVAIKHQNVVNFMVSMVREIDFSPGKTILALTTICFDIFVLETLVPLARGLKLVIADEDQQKDPEGLGNLILKSRVQMLQVTPSRLKLLLDSHEGYRYLQGVKQLMVGGEAFPGNLFEMVKKTYQGKIYNMYGPTETTVWSSVKDLTGREKITIGRPVANTMIYIMDRSQNLQPIGIPGELCIGGQGVVRGYLNRPELTAERFCRDLWDYQDDQDRYHRSYRSHKSYISYLSYYRTGDLACWLADGDIEFLGRGDHQVKIRGFRIEPGEIEKQILEYADVKEAVVITRENQWGEKYLCAYFVPGDTGQQAADTGLRQFLSRTLPGYMIPWHFVEIEKIPLTPNGKIDKKALPEPNMMSREEYLPPADDIEIKLAGIWAELMGIEKDLIGKNANFFKMGGHSLKAIMLAARIHKELNVKIPLTDIFKTPTLKDLARCARERETGNFTAVESVEKREYYALSSAQKRLYVLQQMDLSSTVYNMPLGQWQTGKLSKKKFQAALQQLIKRHESLRTSFLVVNNEPVQQVHEPGEIEFAIEYYDLDRTQVEDEVKVEEKEGTRGLAPLPTAPAALNSQPATTLISSFIRPFDLSRAPLFRVGLIKIAGTKHILIVDLHHIISDEVSHKIFITDLLAFYNGEELPAIRLQYKDYSGWQNNLIRSGALKKQEAYWLKRFDGEIPLLKMPTDNERPDELRFEGRTFVFEIDSQLFAKMKNLIRECEITLNNLLMASYNVLLFKSTGQESILVGNVIAGRPHADLQHIIGFFVNMLAIKNHPEENQAFEDFLMEVKRSSIEAYENQDYQFEELVNQLNFPREPGRHPLIDTVFVLRSLEDNPGNTLAEEKREWTVSPYEIESKVSHFDFMFHATEHRDSITMRVEYSSALFKPGTIKELSKGYTEVLEQVVKNSMIKLKEITIKDEFITANQNMPGDQELTFQF